MDTCDTRSVREVFHEYLDLAQITAPYEVAHRYGALVAGPRVARMARELAAAQARLEAAGMADAEFDAGLETE